MPFKPGEGGRPRGAKNKSSRKVDEAFDAVFDALQLADTTKLQSWAADNLTEFYKLYAKRLTTSADNTSHVVTETVSEEQARREAEAFLESQRIASQRVGQAEPDRLHLSDTAGLPAGGAAPQDS